MGKIIGIDLGTTNSAVVVMEGGTPQLVPDPEGARTTPSIVAFTSREETLVGQIAKRQALTNPERTIHGVKRLIGRRFDSREGRAARRLSPFPIAEAPNGDVCIRVGHRDFSPVEIEALLLRKLKAAAEAYLGEPVKQAIVSVPAYFDERQRQATFDACYIAGLGVVRVLNEATAAALAHGFAERRTGSVVVYDLGGGTFDVSVVAIEDGVYVVLATAGDTYLGGEDFDELIMKWLIDDFRKECQIDLTADRMALLRLKEASERAKCELSTRPQAEIVLPYVAADASGPKHLNTVLTRERFERMIQPMLAYTGRLCRSALRDAGLDAADVDDVVLVGGQTRAPAVVSAVRDIFGVEPSRSVNPDEAVAIGAAIQTGILSGEVTDLVLLDVTAHSLGIETKDATFTPIVERNSNIPTKQVRVFTTVVDGQKSVDVHVLQGEGHEARDKTSLARFRLPHVAPAPRGKPEIEVTFELDVNGILHVSAVDRATGRRREVDARPLGGMTLVELELARIDAERRALAEERNATRDRLVEHLTGLLRSCRRVGQMLEPKLSLVERRFAKLAFDNAEAALGGTTEDIRAALTNLEATAANLALVALRRREVAGPP